MSAQTRLGRRPPTPALVPTLLVSALLLSGCHMHRPIDLPGAAPTSTPGLAYQINPGDTVRVTMKNGEQLSFPVQEVQQDALVARGGKRLPYADIARLEKRQLAKGRTIALVVGITAAALVLLAAVETGSAIASFAGGG